MATLKPNDSDDTNVISHRTLYFQNQQQQLRKQQEQLAKQTPANDPAPLGKPNRG